MLLCFWLTVGAMISLLSPMRNFKLQEQGTFPLNPAELKVYGPKVSKNAAMEYGPCWLLLLFLFDFRGFVFHRIQFDSKFKIRF